MSTKIYNAYRIKNMSGKELLKFLDIIKTECTKNEINRIWELIIKNSVDIIDNGVYHKVNNLSSKDYFTDIYHSCGINGGDYERIKSWLSFQSVLSVSKELVKNKMKKADNDNSILTMEYDVNNSLCMFPSGNHILLMTFGNTINGIMIHMLEDEGWSEFRKKYLFEDYHYQNQTDKPDNVSKSEWNKRERDWDKAMPSGIPSVDGICIKIIDSGSPIFNLERKSTDIYSFIPAKENRVNEISTRQAFEEYLKKHSKTESITAYHEFSRGLEKNIPEVMDLLNKQKKIYEKELPDITWSSLVKSVESYYPEYVE